MKNLSKRNKIVIGIGGLILVLAVVVVFASTALTGNSLFGGSIGISPATMTLVVGQTGTITTSHSKTICKWSNTNTSAVTIVSKDDHKATVQGIAPGTATIKETCGAAGNYTGSTVVTVVAPTPTLAPAPVITSSSCRQIVSDTLGITLTTGNSSTAWSATTSSLRLSATTGASVVVTGVSSANDAYAVVRATNPGSATASLNVAANPLYVKGAPVTVKVGQYVDVDACGLTFSCASNQRSYATWSAACGADIASIAAILTTGETARITGLKAGTAEIWQVRGGKTYVSIVTVTP